MRTTAPSATGEPMSRRSHRATTVFLAFLGILLAFGIDVALPAFDEIRDAFDLDRTGASISLIGTFYFLGMASGQVVYGPLSDRFGRVPALQVGLALYAIGALGAAFSPSFEVLLATRLLWGLGAAGPGALRVAIARDLYEGDEMARVVTIVMAVFLIGPIFVPVIGEGLLRISSWEVVFLVAVGLALLAMAWTAWFGETLAVHDRRPLAARPLLEAANVVFTTRATIGHIAAQTFTGAAFFVHLGSSQPVIDNIYDRADQFAFIFGGMGVVMVAFLLVNDRLISRFGAARMAMVTTQAVVVTSLVGVGMASGWGGVPPLWIFLLWAVITNSLLTNVTPMYSALALEPMGALAGTASAILGFVTLAGGALLAAIVDASIDTTVTPMTVGYLAFTIAALVSLRWAAAPQAT